MMINSLEPVLRLHQYLVTKHWVSNHLVGPDPVGKINWRVTRFVRSYTNWIQYADNYAYLQAQAYWIRANLCLYELVGEQTYLEFATQCANYVVTCQQPNGAWIHPPIPGRRGFISTVEGVWASLGLVAAYRTTGKDSYLMAANRWYEFQVNQVGFQPHKNGLAANYYTHSSIKVPNVTTMLIWLAGELHAATGEKDYLQYTDRMIDFIADSQLASGELPYEVSVRPHFMCYQYNAFELVDLVNFYTLQADQRVWNVLQKLSKFLQSGLTDQASCRYNCHKAYPEVIYWTSALGNALGQAHELGLGDYKVLSERAYKHVLGQQRADGGFDFSYRNYKVLSDRRSYPRYLSMILNHLLVWSVGWSQASHGKQLRYAASAAGLIKCVPSADGLNM